MIAFSPGGTILSADTNSNNAALRDTINTYALLTDVSRTTTVLQTFAAVTLTGTLTGVAGTFSSTLGVTGVLTASGGVVGNLTGNVTGNVTGNLTGNVTGNTSGTSGSTTGNAATATALQTARAINGTNFDGTASITVTAAAGTLTGTVLNATVVTSSLTTFGTLAGHLIFTDNTYDIGASGATRPRTVYAGTSVVTPLLNNSGSTITLRGITYTLPSADGTSGQVLQTNGSAVLSWAAPSSGFITGSGTTGKIAKFTGSAAVGDSILSESGTVATVTGTLVVTGSSLTLGTSPASTGLIRMPNNQYVYGKLSGGTNVQLLGVTSADKLAIGADASLGGLAIGPAGLLFPLVDGTNGQVLQTNGSATLSWTTVSGGVSGLTTGKLPKAASGTTLTDSALTESSGNLTAAGDFAVTGNLTVNGNTTVGNATSDTLTLTARVASHLDFTTDNTFDLGNASRQVRDLLMAGVVKVGGTQVLTSRVTGFAPTFNYLTDKAPTFGVADNPATLAAAAVGGELIKLENLVQAMYNAMVTHGLIGA